MKHYSARRTGLLLLGLLSLGDMSTIFLTDGEAPPYVVAALDMVLGLFCLVLVIQALREPARPVRLLIGLRVLSAVTALPALVIPDAPAMAKVSAVVIVALTAVGVVLTSRESTQAAIS